MAETYTRKSASKSRLRKKYLLPLLAIVAFSMVSYAANVTVTTNSYQSVSGVYYNVSGGFTAASNGFTVVQASGAATGSCAWATGTSCQTALTAGHWYYSVTITAAAGATLPTVAVSWNTGSGYAALGSIAVASGTITTGNTMTFLFDTGVATFTAPTGITITVT
jgi:hypothetical protein